MRRAVLLAVVVGAVALVVLPVVAAEGANGHANYRAVCPSPPTGYAHCHELVVTDSHGNPLASASPTGLSPATIQSVYGFPTGSTAGAGQTIAIVDAYDDPTAASDLSTFSSQYGLPACTTANGCFRKVDQTGGTNYPGTDSGWALEISLDIEWAHAIAPDAKILLVEASSSSLLDLLTAESYATANAQYVSNSWGASEFSGESLFDSYFSGSSVFVSAGDSGLPAEWPSAAPDVISVGGTTLTQNSNGTWSETDWSFDSATNEGGGGGCSAYETANPAQSGFSQYSQVDCGGMRATPDVALDANPSSGVSIYDSTSYQGQSGWFTVGGTSVSSPIWAAASADSGQRVDSSYVYANHIDFNDITAGNNGAACLVGYDLCSGRGSWIYSSSSLLSGGGSSQSPDFTLSASPSSQAVTQGEGTSYTVSTSALNGDTANVALSVTSTLPSGVTATFNPNPVSQDSSSTLTVSTTSSTPTGSYTLTISGSDGTNTHTTSVTLVVQSATQSTLNVTVTAGKVSQKGPNYWVPLTVTATDGNNTGIAGASVQLDVFQGACDGGLPVATGSGTTDSTGQATTKFRTKTAGSWCALAIVTASGYTTATGQTSFTTP